MIEIIICNITLNFIEIFQAHLQVAVAALGQKGPPEIPIATLVDVMQVQDLCVHLGVVLLPADPDHTLLWSRAGMERISGNLGHMYPSLSLRDCANITFTGKRFLEKVSKLLSKMYKLEHPIPAKVIFLQLYNTSPKYSPPEFHSISGMLSSNCCLHYKASFTRCPYNGYPC